MAYSNWGGKVFCGDDPLQENCDVTIDQVLGRSKHYSHYLEHYIENKNKERTPTNQMYHAVVGNKSSNVLVCLYKNTITAIFDCSGSLLLSVPYDDLLEEYKEYTVGGVTVRCSWGESEIEVSFTDSSGMEWVGESGYCIGEGHEEWF